MLWVRLPGHKNRQKLSRRGSAAVLLCILFVTLTGALAVTYEAAERKAAVSVGEAAFENAGRSVLACYDKELFDRYELFAFEGDEEKTEQRLEKLAKTSIEKTKVAGCKVKSVKAEQPAFCLSDPDNLMLQIREITKRTGLVDVLGDLKDDLRNTRKNLEKKNQSDQRVLELENERNEAKKKAQESVERARAAAEDSDEAVLQEDSPADTTELERASAELEEIENAEQQQNNLKEHLNNLNKEPSFSDEGGRTLNNGRIRDSLPSVSAGHKDESAYDGESELKEGEEEGAGQQLSDNLATVAYIEHFFHNKMDGDAGDQRFFQCETEYILYGGMSDKWNYRKAYMSIFAVRMAANMAFLYVDSGKRNLTLELATSITPGPSCILTQILITAIWAMLETYNDMKNLENGRAVPLMKTERTWMMDIDEVAKLIKGISEGELYIPIPEGSPMTYSRYLDMFLLTLSRDTKLYRIMDLIQINLKGTVREDFTIADHYTGFALKAEIGKKSHAVGVGNAVAEINMTHAYLTGG